MSLPVSGLGRAVDLDQLEPRRIVFLLDDVEASDAGLLHAGAGVGETGLAEEVDSAGYDAHVDVNDHHD